MSAASPRPSDGRTSETLLARLRDPADDEAWRRFFALYEPLIVRFARSRGLPPQDVEEVRDASLAAIAAKLPSFGYDPRRGGFRGWIHRIVHGKVVDLLRRRREHCTDAAELADLKDATPTPDESWERMWREEHLRFALDEAAGHVSERTYQVFRLLLLEGASVPEVCARMGMNANQAYKAKARALTAVRDVLQRLGLDPDGR